MLLLEAIQKAQKLREEIKYHNDLYYNHDAPEIDDFTYDKMLRELEDLEAEFPELITEDSPTQKVGGQAGEKFSPVEHAVFTFGIEGISRACSHQLVRHRIASYSQQSQRYVDGTKFEFVTPPEIERNEKAYSAYKKVSGLCQRGEA